MITRGLGALMRGVITLYRWTISPLVGPACRYTPSCSRYAAEAISVHGPFKGAWLGLKRIGRCHPWGGAGHDPVPPACTPDCAHHAPPSNPISTVQTHVHG
jgi:hypothetical protein